MNIMKLVGIAAMVASLAACGSEQPSNQASPPATAETAATHEGAGQVKTVSGNEVTISHGRIETAGWPAMTMTFTVGDPTLLNGIQAGDRVSFAFTKSGSAATLTSISKQ